MHYSAAKLSENGMRELKGSVDQKFACEKRCQLFEEAITVEYEVKDMNMMIKVGE